MLAGCQDSRSECELACRSDLVFGEKKSTSRVDGPAIAASLVRRGRLPLPRYGAVFMRLLRDLP